MVDSPQTAQVRGKQVSQAESYPTEDLRVT
jgi:hypothetical protein